MRRIFTGLFIAAMAVTSVGCSYGAIAAHDGKLYIARNDSFLMGALRKIYECTPSAGSMACVEVKGKP
ncbi:MAG: hypothetical protein IPK80_29910 [Nannocystis sp.]|jgi:hypothetical protein|nr:hypothetical protein [Nannocystis sp.]